MDSQLLAASSTSHNLLQEYYKDVLDEGKQKWECKLCHRVLSSKQRVELHLHKVHDKGPIVRKYKRYVDDPIVPVPKRTLQYWKKTANYTDSTCETSLPVTASHEQTYLELANATPPRSTENDVYENEHSFHFDLPQTEQHQPLPLHDDNDDNDDSSYYLDLSDSSDSSGQYITESEFSESDCGLSDNDSSSCTSDGEIDKNEDPPSCLTSSSDFTPKELASLAIISFVTRYLLSNEATSSFVDLMKRLSPDNKIIQDLSFSKMQEMCGSCNIKVHDYCENCYGLFPDDKDEYSCQTLNCTGLRYKGSRSNQYRQQSKVCFVSVDVCNQLQDLLQRDGMWDSVQERIRRRYSNTSNVLTDIIDGKYYKEYCRKGNFLEKDTNLSMLFNTDGAPLFQSSGISLWPVFLAINEIPPTERFSKKNILIWGLWQGRGKPPFNAYFQQFATDMNTLYEAGINVFTPTGVVCVKAAAILSSNDLQARAYLMNQTQHNGEGGCSTCEESGKVVKQGKGNTRCYPYREENERPIQRSTATILECGHEAHVSGKRTKGFFNVTSLALMPFFDLAIGMVPDYMHGALLGITKTLMYNWFSPTKAKKPCFIGKEIAKLNKRLLQMKPPDFIKRLPRDLEKHYRHFKATELQSWLLFYSMPCLIGILPDKYLQHYSCFVEAVYILLGDSITDLQLDRAKSLLEIFYRDFQILYGDGSCGLNVHNAGAHLADFVRGWGPMWAWSCFGFEDMNGTILEFVHGTGNACRQIVWKLHAQRKLRSDLMKFPEGPIKEFITNMLSTSKGISTLKEAAGCQVAGAAKPVTLTAELQPMVAAALNNPSIDGKGLLKVLRVLRNGQVFFSQEYTRVKKRNSYTVLLAGGAFAKVQYFLWYKPTGEVMAVCVEVPIDKDRPFFLNDVGCHLVRIHKERGEVRVEKIENLLEKVVLLDGNPDHACVSRVPNFHGLSV